MLGVALNLDGSAYLSAPHLTGSETISSSGGTSTPTVSAGKVSFTAGTLWDLVLSDGTRYPMSERAGLKIHDVSGSGNHGWLVSAPSTVWETPDNDFLWELDYGANPAFYCDGSGSLQVASPSQSLTTFTFAARITTALPAQAVLSEFFQGVGNRPVSDHDLSGVDLRTSWQWLIVTCDGSTGKTYVNGALSGSDAVSLGSPTFSGTWFSAIGAPENPFYCERFLVFSRVLSSGEITALNSANTIPASGVIMNYQATHSTADPIKDRSGANNTGAGMANIPIANIPALEAKNGVDAMGLTVLNPSFTRVALSHSSDFPPYEEPLTLRGKTGEKRWYVVRARNFEDGKAASPELVRVIQQQH